MLTRRHLQVGLGVVWLVDAALQYQPYMFSSAFSRDSVASAADGQPGWVGAGVHWAAHLMAAAPVVTNALFATVQLLLGICLLYRRTTRIALLGSVLWGMSVWYFGEGLGGIASGHATIITGAPGAALIYAMVATLAWPASSRARIGAWATNQWTAIVFWALIWCGAAVLQVLPAQRHSWLLPIPLAAALLLVGIAPVFGCRTARAAAATGATLGLTFWGFGQSLGNLSTGQATDPNTGPLLVLLALALLVGTSQRSDVDTAYPAEPLSRGAATSDRTKVGGFPTRSQPGADVS